MTGSGRNILVTGGAGYIGAHACKSLSASGYRPIAYDDLTLGHREAVRWGPLVVGDIADAQKLRRTIEDHDVSAVLHFAASAYVGESIVNPRKYFNNNTAKTIAMLDCLLDVGVSKVVFSSTCATYGMPTALPIKESHPQAPINPYGDSKLFVEKLLRWYGNAYHLNWFVLRYFNAAGADPSGDIGESHVQETHLIPLALEATMPHGRALKIFGSDYPTPDGTAIRDYIHVTDLADAHVSALQRLETASGKRAVNLGTGHGYSIMQIIDAVERVTGQRARTEFHARRPGDPAELVADPSAAKECLGWAPKYSSLKTIIETAWNWAIRGNRAISAIAT